MYSAKRLNIWCCGELLYRFLPLPKSYNIKVGNMLLQLYGHREYVERIKRFWIRKFGIHLYVVIMTIAVTYKESPTVALAGITFGQIGTHYYIHEKLKERSISHRQNIIEGFFEFSSLFTLMINAGLNYKNALHYSIGDHQFSPYLRNALQKMSSGTSEIIAFEEIPVLCREMVITRYFACITKGLRHGNRHLRKDLQQITTENWQEKLNLHRKKGETLKTKLVLPLMLIFVGILMILLLPVMIQFQLMM